MEVEQLLTRRAAVAAEFEAAVPDTEGFKEQLAKIFNKWVALGEAGRGVGCVVE